MIFDFDSSRADNLRARLGGPCKLLAYDGGHSHGPCPGLADSNIPFFLPRQFVCGNLNEMTIYVHYRKFPCMIIHLILPQFHEVAATRDFVRDRSFPELPPERGDRVMKSELVRMTAAAIVGMALAAVATIVETPGASVSPPRLGTG